MRTTVVVMAKSPVPGRVKTRLCPPCSPAEAAAIAEASLADTLDAVAATSADRRLLVLDGAVGPWLPPGFDVVAQVDGGLDRRLDAAWREVDGPAVQLGMDTPQVTPAVLDGALACLGTDGVDAVLGLAIDGGWWAVGFTAPPAAAFVGVPMSRTDTGTRQHERLHRLGLRVALLAPQRDIDTFDDALAVAAMLPGSRTAQTVHRVGLARSA